MNKFNPTMPGGMPPSYWLLVACFFVGIIWPVITQPGRCIF